jgi:hypothetical protein
MREPGFPIPSDFAAASTHDNQTREMFFSRTALNPKDNVPVLQKCVVGLRLPLAIIDPSSTRNPPY